MLSFMGGACSLPSMGMVASCNFFLCMLCSCDILHSTKGLSPFAGVDMVSHEIPVLSNAQFCRWCLLTAANGHGRFLLILCATKRILCATERPLTLQVFTCY